MARYNHAAVLVYCKGASILRQGRGQRFSVDTESKHEQNKYWVRPGDSGFGLDAACPLQRKPGCSTCTDRASLDPGTRGSWTLQVMELL
ncbi:hypothetical protein NDU88_006874 [Pleurodeles waltl]|uniref:Uncharacterized protein n=1 Tax=Pleurodeles waltl TaxID=8319 RepID=A0AAV7MNK7_PLEWA|nr:hypothetical protein NDU88_006874 [Pleurodeles waltl]